MSNIYDYMNNIYIYGKNYGDIIGTLSNKGANPQAPYYDDLYIQELDTGADTFQFTTMSTPYTQDLLEIGNHIGFHYNNRYEMFTITSLEYSHYEGYKTIGVYAEGIGFELLEIFMEKPEVPSNGGNDVDGDGDDNTDDEYADVDHFYVDETGVIIWDKDGSGPPSEDDITVDGDGNIIYRPSRNNKNDSLEFKNISYPTFLNILLKNSGWSFVCQPGLESIKHDISVRYDTNIYAILQDSMQAYRGVELEFVHEGISRKGPAGEYYYSDVKKIIKAYKDGGRGSFVGKRFEYGTNVRGITKTQEVTQNKEDSVIYIDNIGVDVYYDIDFALKSAEVPEIEIGDTHYVIDRDFCPPMTIKARIGKIEVSFSDPTKNKITVANTKKIMGSAVDDEDIEKTIRDIDDKIDDAIDDGIYDGFDLSDYATMTYVDDAIEAAQLGDGNLPSDVFEVIDGTLHIKLPVGFENSANFINCGLTSGMADLTGIVELDAMTIYCANINPVLDGSGVVQIDGDLKVTGNITSSGGGSGSGDYLVLGGLEAEYANITELKTAVISNDPDPMSEQYVEFRSDIKMLDYSIECKTLTQSSDKSLKENIRYIDDSVMTTSDDLLEKVDLYDFIVNQIDLCEYNFIGDTSDKIGFIANDYEGTKVGDKIVSRKGENDTLTYSPDNLLFATIGALQEEVRMRDEKIATLEDRLAAIEEMLNNK